MATSARLEELLQKFRDNPRRYFAPLANEHRKLGELEQAISLCRTHLPQQPQHVSGHIVLGQALFDAGEVSDARTTFEHALDLDHENLIALRFLGDIARAQGEHLTARQWYERVLEADPRNDEIAKLIRDIEQSDATTVATPPSADESMHAGKESADAVSFASVPNDTETESPAADEPQAAQPIEDLAAAWQHEVAALDDAGPVPSFDAEQEDFQRASMSTDSVEPELELETEFELRMESGPESATEPEWASEQTALSVPAPELELPTMEPAQATAPDSPPAQEPNEPWLEPDEQFVSTSPAAEPAPLSAPPPHVEIDYSMFEAVADEEGASAAMPLEGVSAESDAESFEPPPAADDWFATPNLQDTEVAASESPNEAAFDLDAAFQGVLPNVQEFAPPDPDPGLLPNVLEFAPADHDQGVMPNVQDFAPADSDVVESPADVSAFADEPPATSTEEWLSAEIESAAADDDVSSLTVDSGDSVDDAFAELDRLTASLEADVAGGAMLLPDEEYVSADSLPQQPELLIGRTPDLGVPVVEETPSAFVTETMAELYLQQGFREEALVVYRQLLAMNPDDAVLIQRVEALEGAALPVAESAADSDFEEFRPAPPQRADAAGQSVRSFLGVFARRRAPMRRRERIVPKEAVPQRDSALAALFGAPQHADESSAAVLAAAFAVPNVDTESIPGRPTRAAAAELSLGEVFGGGAATNAANAASFDEFFSTGSTDGATQSPLDEEGSDMVQFTAWLEGLKKK